MVSTGGPSRSVLYMTYDGMTDPIGQAQVLPYLLASALAGHRITLVSFEKQDRLAKLGHRVRDLLDAHDVSWQPQRFRSSPPYLSKWLDQVAMYRAGARQLRYGAFEVIHCRSYVAAVAGLKLKQRFGSELIFDMRGFLPDQRREGGRWTSDNPLKDYIYKRWKKHEARLLANSDHIIVLTNAAKEVIQKWPTYSGSPISVVPCCADFEKFRVASEERRAAARRSLGISLEEPALVYLGSLGTVYLLKDMLRFFSAFRSTNGPSKLLLLGPHSVDAIVEQASQAGLDLQPEEIRVIEADREMVSFYTGAADAGICFCVPTFSSLGVSPTKVGEYLACGVPLYTNRGIGDLEELVASLDAGHVLSDFSGDSLVAAARDFTRLKGMDKQRLRANARTVLDLDLANRAYNKIYADLARAQEICSAG